MCLLNWQLGSLCVMWWISCRFFFGVQRKHNKKFGWFCFYPSEESTARGDTFWQNTFCVIWKTNQHLTAGGGIFGCSYSACDLLYSLSVLIDIKYELTLSKDIRSHKRTETRIEKGMQQLFWTETNIGSSNKCRITEILYIKTCS